MPAAPAPKQHGTSASAPHRNHASIAALWTRRGPWRPPSGAPEQRHQKLAVPCRDRVTPSTREHDLSRLRILVVALAVAVSAPVAVAGCGSSSSSNNEDPNQVLKETFSNPTRISSGNLSIDLSGSAEGTQSGSLNATIDGPFQSDKTNPDAFPQFDLNAKVDASGAGQSFNFDGGLITTTDNAYVEYQGQAYEVGTALFKRFQQNYQQAQSEAQVQNQAERLLLLRQVRHRPVDLADQRLQRGHDRRRRNRPRSTSTATLTFRRSSPTSRRSPSRAAARPRA